MTSLRSTTSELTNQTDFVSLDKGVLHDINRASGPDFLMQKVSPLQSGDTEQIRGTSSIILKSNGKKLCDEDSEESELKLNRQESAHQFSQSDA